MSEEEFLTRWSRRKREARENVAPPEPEKPADAPTEPLPPATEGHEPEVDVSSLPSIDSITSATDVTAFLRKGIPQQLTRAALRRAWETDPAIRDFVGLAENAWDFNDPNAMPGFGPLDYSETELKTLVDRIVGGVEHVAKGAAMEMNEREHATSAAAESAPSNEMIPSDLASSAASSPCVAPQQESSNGVRDEGGTTPRPRHGGALPRTPDLE